MASHRARSVHFKNPYSWSLKSISDNPAFADPQFGINEQSRKTRYSIRALRYWFGDHLLRRQAKALGRPIQVCEIGVDRGQMLLFSKGVDTKNSNHPWDRWDAMSLRVDKEKLTRIGYSNALEIDLAGDTTAASGEYDVVIMLHILEHLHDPEHALALAKRLLRPGGIIIGGFPGLPRYFEKWHEGRLRQKARKWGHVSAFSSGRVRRMAEELDMTVDFLSGTFFFRSSGFYLENFPLWIRLNLLFGAALPSYAGELYWAMRK